MVTMCDAPRFPDKAIALSNPLLCLFKDEGRRQCVEPMLCVSPKALHECICAVWGYCVCVSLAGMTQECPTGCRKKIPESMWKTHSEVPVTVTQRHMKTLNYVPRVQFTHSHIRPLCVLSLSYFLSPQKYWFCSHCAFVWKRSCSRRCVWLVFFSLSICQTLGGSWNYKPKWWKWLSLGVLLFVSTPLPSGLRASLNCAATAPLGRLWRALRINKMAAYPLDKRQNPAMHKCRA